MPESGKSKKVINLKCQNWAIKGKAVPLNIIQARRSLAGRRAKINPQAGSEHVLALTSGWSVYKKRTSLR